MKQIKLYAVAYFDTAWKLGDDEQQGFVFLSEEFDHATTSKAYAKSRAKALTDLFPDTIYKLVKLFKED